MSKLPNYVVLTAFLCIPLQSLAQTNAIQPGEYVTEGGYGNLTIAKGKAGGLSFEITAIGANGHICDLSGTIRNGHAKLNEGAEGKPCIVTFEPTEKGIKITDNDGACRSYCGARASFTDLYFKPQPGCKAASIQKTRTEFKRLYDRKAYSQARAKLEPMLKNCANLINWYDIGWIRNDLALTQFKLGDFAGCRSTLQPLEENAKQTDEALREQYPPVDAEIAIPIAKASRTNLKLCTPGRKKP